jgi:O-antigen/teichoic acid export membrane protein
MQEHSGLRILKNAISLAIAKISVPFLSFFFIMYAARLLGVEEFGQYILVQTYFQLFLAFCVDGLNTIVTRDVAKYPEQMHRYLNGAFAIVFLVFLASNIILIALAYIFNYQPDTRMAVFIVGLSLLPAATATMCEAAFIAFEKAGYVTFGTITENIIRVLTSFLLLTLGFGILSLFITLLITRTLLLIYYLIMLNHRIAPMKFQFELDFTKNLIRTWVVFTLQSWVTSLYDRMDVIFISFFRGATAVGIYGAAEKLRYPFSILTTSFTLAIFPHFSRLYEQSKEAFERTTQRIMKYALVVMVFGTVIVAVFAHEIIILLYGEEYSAAVPVLSVLILVQVPELLINLLSRILFSRNEQKKVLKAALIGLVLKAALALAFIPLWGVTGAAISYLTSITIACSIYFVMALTKEQRLPILIAFGKILLAGITLAVLMLMLNQFHMIVLVSLAVVVYPALLLLLRLPSPEDIATFQEIAQQGRKRIDRMRSRA